MPVDEPSVIGLSIRTRSRHNYTGVQGASLRRRLGLRGARTETRKSKSCSRVLGCVIYVCRERNPRVPVCLALVYVVSEVLNQHTVASLNTSLRFWMEGSGLNLLNLSILQLFQNTLLIKFAPWSVCGIYGEQYVNTIFFTKSIGYRFGVLCFYGYGHHIVA